MARLRTFRDLPTLTAKNAPGIPTGPSGSRWAFQSTIKNQKSDNSFTGSHNGSGAYRATVITVAAGAGKGEPVIGERAPVWVSVL